MAQAYQQIIKTRGNLGIFPDVRNDPAIAQLRSEAYQALGVSSNPCRGGLQQIITSQKGHSMPRIGFSRVAAMIAIPAMLISGVLVATGSSARADDLGTECYADGCSGAATGDGSDTGGGGEDPSPDPGATDYPIPSDYPPAVPVFFPSNLSQTCLYAYTTLTTYNDPDTRYQVMGEMMPDRVGALQNYYSAYCYVSSSEPPPSGSDFPDS